MKFSKKEEIKLVFAKKYSFRYLILLQRELQFHLEMQKFQKHFGHGKTTSHRKGKIEQRVQEIKAKVFFVRSIIRLKKNLERNFFSSSEIENNKTLYEFLDLKKHNIRLKGAKK